MMSIQLSKINLRYLTLAIFLLLTLSTTACAGASPDAAAPMEAPAEEIVETSELAVMESDDGASGGTQISTGVDEASSASVQVPAKRLIIKNAELSLIVEDTDVAIDRSMGIVTEYNGYVVSNRTWLSREEKYATLAIGVPSENFEEMLRRLKDIAVTVNDEMVSGQDVTDEYVDLESRLRNLEATANRIRTFMEQAETVEESLAVSAQLSEIEGQIEQIKGRMTYLQDRVSFSNITIQLIPEAGHNPLVAAIPWTPTQSVERALSIAGTMAHTLYRVAVELVVLFIIVVLPFVLPLVLLIWGGLKVVRRMGMVKAKAS